MHQGVVKTVLSDFVTPTSQFVNFNIQKTTWKGKENITNSGNYKVWIHSDTHELKTLPFSKHGNPTLLY